MVLVAEAKAFVAMTGSTSCFTKKHGLVSDEIWGIQEDKSGNIYFDTQDGVGKFDGQTFSILAVNNTSDATWKLEPDDLWFKGNWNKNGPYRFDGKNLYHLEFPKNELADKLYADFPNMTWSPYGIYALYHLRKFFQFRKRCRTKVRSYQDTIMGFNFDGIDKKL